MSLCVQTAKLYPSTTFCTHPMFAIHNGAARHCCLATAPLPNQRNPCIEQSLRTHTMLRWCPASRPQSYMFQQLFAQRSRSALLPRKCSAASATLASNKACAHAPCSGVILHVYASTTFCARPLFAMRIGGTRRCGRIAAPQPAQPLHRTKLAHTHHAQDVVLRAARTAVCFITFWRTSTVCNAQRSRSALLPHNCSGPPPPQPLHRTKLALLPHNCSGPPPPQPLHRTKLAQTHHAKMSSCVYYMLQQLFAHVHCLQCATDALATAASQLLRKQRNPCIEQNLRARTMLRCHCACRPQSYILQQRFAHIQCLQYTTEPLGTAASQLLCSATSATLASNKACAHAPCSRCRPACSPHSCMLHYLLAHVHCLQCATEPLGTAASQLLRSATSATLASNKACAHTPCSRCRPACRPNSYMLQQFFAQVQRLQCATKPLGTAASQLLRSATSATLASNKACAHAPC